MAADIRIPPPPTRTAVVHYSFVKLPDTPMMGRLQDDRVGFFGFFAFFSGVAASALSGCVGMSSMRAGRFAR